MRKLCPNFDREDGLDTVLEVPIPEEMFANNSKTSNKSWQNVKSWMKSHNNNSDKSPTAAASTTALLGGKNTEIQLLLGVVGAPLIPLPVHSDDHHDLPINKSIKDHPIVSYILLNTQFNVSKFNFLTVVKQICYFKWSFSAE